MRNWTVNTIQDRRQAVTAINIYDASHGISPSQRAKYDHQVWYFILQVLPGNDGQQMTTLDIQTALVTKGVHYSLEAIKRGLRLMENPRHFAHPHIRGCGKDLASLMRALGGLKRPNNWSPSNPLVYGLGETSAVVKEELQNFGIV